MNLTLRLPFKAIEDMLNQTFGERLHEGKAHNPGGLITYVEVFKEDRIKVYGRDNRILTVVPVRVRVKMRKNDPLIVSIIKDLSNVERTQFEIEVAFHTEISIGEDGHLQSKTTSEFSWISKPKVGIGLVKVKIAELVKPSLEKELLALTREIDENIHEQVNLAWYASLALDEMEKPLETDSQIPVWLTLLPQPENIQIEEIQFELSGLALPIRFQMNPCVYSGFLENDYPKISIELPPIEKVSEIPEKFHLPITAEISYDFLNKELSGQNIHDQKNQAFYRIKTLSFNKKDEKMRVDATFKGEAKRLGMNIRFEGNANISNKTKPDQNGESLILDEFSLKLENIPFWAKWYHRLNRKKIDRQIENHINQAIQEQLQKVKSDLDSILEDYEIIDGLRLRTKLERLVPNNCEARRRSADDRSGFSWRNGIDH